MKMTFAVLLLVGCRTGLDVPSGSSPPASPGSSTCSSLTDPASCAAAGCTPDLGCPTCSGPGPFTCYSPGGVHTELCSNLVCDCASATTADECDSVGSCHALYLDPGTCDCDTIDCCLAYTTCADGPAQCVIPPSFQPKTCALTADEVVCEGTWTRSYDEHGCPEGCVHTPICSWN